ncbi:flagellar hook protein FlgE [Aidingimonas halophila]|uniref:Flagellar hook protein FlgE n=1 Tax=Aidingimonas halophila TaxID=574349 RepID=A0A1H3B850_9GAMM|nr:flagellar hook protein FlgE [Aidingimonas halophila]GHC26056.1 flagellar hook protein FlgE [Aidingimonas halophila]SDX37975.1 flagellar hook protein FlgE [Aidingimonas halophila]
MGFSQALSGINAAADNLDVVGNNISNSQTVGFKSSNTQFADVYAGAEVGLGTRVSGVMQDFSDGTLESSGRDLDLAISGDGFFRMTQNDQVVYSRNGQLSMTSDGYLQNAQGARLTGYPAGVGAGGQPEELQVPSDALEATATTGVEASLNLDSGSEELTAGGIDPNDSDTYSYSNSATVYDSLGNSHDVTMYFAKVAENEWEMQPTIDGESADTGGDTSLSFNDDGTLDGNAIGNYTYDPGNGAEEMDFDFDFAGSTQFGNDFELSSLNQDGYSSGSLVGTTIDESGNIIGNYSNEESQVLGTIAMANFRNPEGLDPVGDNAWAETSESGQALLGQAGEGVFGSIESGTIETSNVDLNGELVDLIIAQRNYQANSQTVKVQDEVLQGTVNLR